MILDIENTKQKEFYTEPRPVIIAIDYDGTLVTEKEYDNPNYVPKSTALMNTLIDLKKKYGNKLYYILWTCRYKEDGSLKECLDFCSNYGLYFDNINENYPNLPFSTSNKIYANLYIDNRSIINYMTDNIEDDHAKAYKFYIEFLIQQNKDNYHLDEL
jgi:hypothetical protein